MTTTVLNPAAVLTRRQVLTGAGALGLLSMLPAPVWGQEPGAFPVTIEHRFGATTIPKAPERVVSVGLTEQDALLALGVVPIAINDWFGFPTGVGPWATDELGGATIEVLSSPDGYDFERIAALRPDLIIGIHYGPSEEDDYTKLSQIAPTVVTPREFATVNTPWQEMTRLIGRALGREEQAAELVAQVEGLFADARAEHPEFEGATAVPAWYGGGTFGFYGPEELRGRFLTSLGFQFTPKAAALVAPDETVPDLSEEQLELLDGDVIVWFSYSPENQKEIEDSPVYQSLEVAREGRALFVGNGDQTDLAAALSFSSVLSLPFAIDGLVPLLAAALAGEDTSEAAS
ncbi:MAG: iron-siderophore ABC transporter substrate-binding protein [Egibacteraceae bacterium]